MRTCVCLWNIEREASSVPISYGGDRRVARHDLTVLRRHVEQLADDLRHVCRYGSLPHVDVPI